MDHRDLAAHTQKWYTSIDLDKMTATVEAWDENGDEFEIEVPVKFEVCPTCNGKGKHVNPSIDAHGITGEEFAEDPDFAEDYFRGRYDVTCYECGGRNVVPEIDESTCPKENLELVRNVQRSRAEWAREEAYERRMGF